jgi:hypothetical protein
MSRPRWPALPDSVELGSSGYRGYVRNADPEALEAAQRGDRRPEVFSGDRGLVQHFDMALMHHLQPVAQFGALLS